MLSVVGYIFDLNPLTLMQVTGNPEQSVVALNLGKNQTNDAPNSNSEVLGDIRTHRTTDAPNFNSEVTKESLSASANSAAASSLNQGRNVMRFMTYLVCYGFISLVRKCLCLL